MRQLAELIDEDHSTVVKIETRVRKISAIEYYQLCKALQADPMRGFEIVDRA